MIVSTFERKVFEDWLKYTTPANAEAMLNRMRDEMGNVDAFGTIQAKKVNGMVVEPVIPVWAEEMRRGVIPYSSGKVVSAGAMRCA